MDPHVMVAMGPNEASEHALEHALERYPRATISVIHVTESNNPISFLKRRDPEDYMVPGCDFDDEMVPGENRFSRAQRKRAEYVFEQACALSEEYGREIDLVVKSGKIVTELAAYAEEQNVDQIVLPDHISTELRPTLRSVSGPVARAADTPVTIVP